MTTLDGEQDKPQVLEFIEQMAVSDYRARILQSVSSEMLSKSALRPTIAHVCEKLAEVCLLPSVLHN